MLMPSLGIVESYGGKTSEYYSAFTFYQPSYFPMSTAPSNHSTNIMLSSLVFSEFFLLPCLFANVSTRIDSRRLRFMLTISKECSIHHHLWCLGVILYLKLFSELHVGRWQNGLG